MLYYTLYMTEEEVVSWKITCAIRPYSELSMRWTCGTYISYRDNAQECAVLYETKKLTDWEPFLRLELFQKTYAKNDTQNYEDL